MRTIPGFALAPLASGILQALLMGNPMAFGLVLFSYPVALVLGIPAFLTARHLGWTSLRATVLGGAGLGFLAALPIALYAAHNEPDMTALAFGLLLFAVHGAAVALPFLFLALRSSS